MSLRRRTSLLFLVTLAIVAVSVIVLARSFEREVDRQGIITDQIDPAARAATELRSANARTAAGIAQYVVTGDSDELALAETSRGESDRLLRSLEDLVAGESALELAVSTVAQAHSAWTTDEIDPILTEMKGGRTREAAAKLDAPAFQARFDELDVATDGVARAIDSARAQGLSDLRGITRDLGIALGIAAILAIGIATFSMLALRAWILSPLDRVRADLREAALLPSHETPIERTGPAEIAEVAGDAEALRRALLREIDAAMAARVALEHGAPAVVALRDAMVPPAPTLPDGFAVFGTTRAAAGVIAGDWWDAIPLASGGLGLVIADVSGHDLDAGVMAVGLRSVFRTGLLSGLEPHAVMELAATELRPTGKALTAFIAVIGPDSGVLRWANAGHHPPLLLGADQTNRWCNTTGPLLSPLGGTWRTDEAPFTPGDMCFACTDGLIESLDVEGVDLGPQGLLALIEGLPASERDDPSELAERIISRARLRACSWNEDDITVLAFGSRAGRSAGSAAVRQ